MRVKPEIRTEVEENAIANAELSSRLLLCPNDGYYIFFARGSRKHGQRWRLGMIESTDGRRKAVLK
jgi:hypothetical protein